MQEFTSWNGKIISKIIQGLNFRNSKSNFKVFKIQLNFMCSVKVFSKIFKISSIFYRYLNKLSINFRWIQLLKFTQYPRIIYIHSNIILWQAGMQICSSCSFVCLHFHVVLSLLGTVWPYVSHDIVCYARQISLSVYMFAICLNWIKISEWVPISLICTNISLSLPRFNNLMKFM